MRPSRAASLVRFAALIALLLPGAARGLEVRRLDLSANDMVADRLHDRIYVSVRQDGHRFDRRVVAVDPGVPAIVDSAVAAFVDDYGGQLGIDPQGRALYVREQGYRIRRVSPSGSLPDLTIDTAPVFQAYGVPLSITVMPTNPAVAVFSSDYVTAAYDGAVPRPIQLGGGKIVFSDDPTGLYQHDGPVRLDPTGLHGIAAVRLLSSFDYGFSYDAGVVYGSTGRAVDVKARKVLGTYPDGNGAILSVAARNRVYVVGTYRGPNADLKVVRIYDRARFVLLESIPIGDSNSGVRGLVPWGTDGIAFLTGDRPGENRLYLLGSGFAACGAGTDCDDGNGCTVDACRDGACVHPAVECAAHGCPGPVTCDPRYGCLFDRFSTTTCEDDGDACTDDVCGPQGCEHRPTPLAGRVYCRLEAARRLVRADEPLCRSRCTLALDARIERLVQQVEAAYGFERPAGCRRAFGRVARAISRLGQTVGHAGLKPPARAAELANAVRDARDAALETIQLQCPTL